MMHDLRHVKPRSAVHTAVITAVPALLAGLAMLAGPTAAANESPLVINEIHADPDSVAGDANGDGTPSVQEDEFLEIVNTSDGTVNLGGFTVSDLNAVRHTFGANTLLPAGCAMVVFGGGTPTGGFGGARVETASSGALGLNNSSENVVIADGAGQPVASVTYGSLAGGDQSITRDPDLSGDFVQHTTTGDGTGPRFSPGIRIDGSPFATDCQNPPPSITVGERSGAPGESVDIPLVFDARSGDYDGLGFEIVFDATRFSTVTCTLANPWANYFLSNCRAKPSTTGIWEVRLIRDFASSPIETGTVGTLAFNIASDAQFGPVPLTLQGVDLGSGFATPVLNNGQVTIALLPDEILSDGFENLVASCDVSIQNCGPSQGCFFLNPAPDGAYTGECLSASTDGLAAGELWCEDFGNPGDCLPNSCAIGNGPHMAAISGGTFDNSYFSDNLFAGADQGECIQYCTPDPDNLGAGSGGCPATHRCGYLGSFEMAEAIAGNRDAMPDTVGVCFAATDWGTDCDNAAGGLGPDGIGKLWTAGANEPLGMEGFVAGCYTGAEIYDALENTRPPTAAAKHGTKNVGQSQPE